MTTEVNLRGKSNSLYCLEFEGQNTLCGYSFYMNIVPKDSCNVIHPIKNENEFWDYYLFLLRGSPVSFCKRYTSVRQEFYGFSGKFGVFGVR